MQNLFSTTADNEEQNCGAPFTITPVRQVQDLRQRFIQSEKGCRGKTYD
jgi:hypothetical protein